MGSYPLATRRRHGVARLVTMAVVILATPRAAFPAACGDVNASGTTTVADVQVPLQAVTAPALQVGLCGGAGYASCADVDGGGTTNVADAVTLLRTVNGLPICGQAICQSPGPVLAGCPGTATLPTDITSNLVVPAGCDARV